MFILYNLMFNNLGKRHKGALNSSLLSCFKRNCLLYNVILWSGFSFTHSVCFVTVLSAFEALQRDVPACTGTCYTNYTLTYLSPRPRVCRSVGVFPESITNTIKVSFFLFSDIPLSLIPVMRIWFLISIGGTPCNYLKLFLCCLFCSI